ncbi:Naringenin,2-oxoglutarate 3-dioxygenase [Cytospora mali]|uniref:Naringenin,2-oxoglutarate 3-dioxygenase n=1 Tax=Cytospora mali TaxID=578113 RepID=A0A194W1V0_CYTMA|nr:Naringenin,2-oxoglutarate 3-dioxygenase [Valsa mali]
MSSKILPGPFPDQRPFSVAQLQAFSFQKLLSQDADEIARLLAAGETDGFFYLDLTAPESRGLWDDYQKVLSIMAAFFDQPLGEKLPFAYGSDVQGYKPIGTQTGATEHSRDGFETIRVAMDGLERTDEPLPPALLNQKALFNDFITKTRFHVKAILAAFSTALGLEGDARYEASHPDDKPSNSSMTFHRYPRRDTRDTSNVGHNKHTDISSIAFLFAQQWGLQVPASATAGPDEWVWVQPRPGHAICNIGDSLRFLSGMRLRSVLHRVVPVAEMETSHRYSIAYFTRPAHGTMFRDSEGRMIACDEWFSHKFDVYRASHAEQRMNTILTGGMESEEIRAKVVEIVAT